MKKIIVLVILSLFCITNVFAQGIGYIDYNKVVNDYSLTKKYKKDLDFKTDSLKEYVKKQETKIKNAQTKEEKQEIQKQTYKEIENMQKDYITSKENKEKEVINNIKKAAEKVRTDKNLDIILKKDMTVSGGVDCTNDVIKELK